MSQNYRQIIIATALSVISSTSAALAVETIPQYSHIFVIIEENKGYDQIMSHPEWTPVIHKLAAEYGLASQFYGEVHPSEGNYIAMLGGDTFGIHDDDAFYCKPGFKNEFCGNSGRSDYVDHSLAARSLMDQMAEKGLTWKAYLEDIPSAGSLTPLWPTSNYPVTGSADGLYAAKHNGFVNFNHVRAESFPNLMDRFVNFSQLDTDLAMNKLPNYAHIVANQCNEMHGEGIRSRNVPAYCDIDTNLPGLIQRGDAEIGMLVGKIMHAKVWSETTNTAIIVTFDEDNSPIPKIGQQGCCGSDPNSAANFGGGHIVTLVITNHGPRHVIDPTLYNHYSLLRTTEAVFGITEYLAHAADKSVVTMTPLFATPVN
jgi:phosphatidylinositol-3-phosphatase